MSRMSFFAVKIRFPFTVTKWPSPNLIQYKTRSIKTWFAKIGVEELHWNDLEPWDVLEP